MSHKDSRRTLNLANILDLEMVVGVAGFLCSSPILGSAWKLTSLQACPHVSQSPPVCSRKRISPTSTLAKPSIATAPRVEILYVSPDHDFVVINKPSGLLVHRNEKMAKGERVFAADETRRLLLQRGIDVPVRVVHRLDRATSGVMTFALGDSDSATRLTTALRRRKTDDLGANDPTQARKEYWAIVRSECDRELLTQWTNENPLKDVDKGSSNRTTRVAYTQFELLATLDETTAEAVDGLEGQVSDAERRPSENPDFEPHRVCVVRAELRTGRRHQIRRHLSYDRLPILGDTTYGKGRHNREARRLYGVQRLALHSRRLSFVPPLASEEGPLSFEAPVPRDLVQALERMPGYCHKTSAQSYDLG